VGEPREGDARGDALAGRRVPARPHARERHRAPHAPARPLGASVRRVAPARLAAAFNRSVRRECLSQAYSSTRAEVQAALARWSVDYNNYRPHPSSANLPPAHFGAWRAATQIMAGPTFRTV
jgi:hypothetical protein